MENNVSTPSDGLYLTRESENLLKSIAKWTKFLSILGFAILGVMLIIILSAGVLISGMNSYAMATDMHPYIPGVFSWGYALFYIIMIVVYFVPLFFLFRFSNRVKIAVETKSITTLNQSFRFLNTHYMFIGILALVGITCFIFTLIFMFIHIGGIF